MTKIARGMTKGQRQAHELQLLDKIIGLPKEVRKDLGYPLQK